MLGWSILVYQTTTTTAPRRFCGTTCLVPLVKHPENGWFMYQLIVFYKYLCILCSFQTSRWVQKYMSIKNLIIYYHNINYQELSTISCSKPSMPFSPFNFRSAMHQITNVYSHTSPRHPSPRPMLLTSRKIRGRKSQGSKTLRLRWMVSASPCNFDGKKVVPHEFHDNLNKTLAT